MSYILSIETSAKVCSVALHNGHNLLGCYEQHIEKSHSRIVTILIESLLKESGLEKEELNAIAVSKGPGSYTGLRIGVSTAKGLCFALDKPLIAVNTLQALAYEVSRYYENGYLLCPMIDARRMEVYTALFDGKATFLEETKALVLDENSFNETLERAKVVFFGDGADKFRILKEGDPNSVFLPHLYPSAKNVGYLAAQMYEDGCFENVIYFEPFYLKDFMSTGKVE